MKKNQEAEKNPEIQPFEAYFDELLKEMESDHEYVNYTVPEDWDREFRAAIKEGIREQRKKERKLKIKRITKVTGVAAAIAVLICTSNLIVEEVQGKGILKFFQSIFDLGDDKHVTYGTDEKMSMEFPDEDNGDIFFDGESLDEVFGQIRSELKMPMFYCDDVFESYEIWEAKYSKAFHILNIEIRISDETVYITQEFFNDQAGLGNVTNEECIKINNENLKEEIAIYKSKSDDGYSFNLKEGQTLFSVYGEMSLEECEKIAINLRYE